MPNYSHVGGEFSPSARRIVLISAFLAASVTAFALYRSHTTEAPAVPVADVSIPVLPAVAAATAPVAEATQSAPANDVATQPESHPLTEVAVAASIPVPPASEWTTVSVKPGESISNIFDAQQLPAEDWLAVSHLNGDSLHLRKLKAGDQIQMKIKEGRLDELTYAFDELHTLDIRRASKGFEAATTTAELEHRPGESSGVINNSLFADAHKAGLNDRLILAFADLFGYDIDFAQDLQEGDHFSVVYDQTYKNGKKLRDGDILAAEFVNQGHHYRAVRYVAADGTKTYYAPNGQALRTAFIRTPVDFVRISSGFSLHRWHPILNIMRAHKGVDYAAATGTPVHATGDGKVEFLGKKGGYGNVLMIAHSGNIETVYGHLSRFASGLREGAKVRQGQVVAYVGMTGLATAPHLHYEFRVNGIHQDPVKVALPRAFPLDSHQLAQFRSEATPLVARLDSMGGHQYAKAGP